MQTVRTTTRSGGLPTGSRRLDLFLIAVYAAGILGAATGLWRDGTRVSTHLVLLAVYAAASAPYLVSLGSNSYLSTAFPFILAAAVLLGPAAAVITAAAAGASLAVTRRSRMPLRKAVFNVCNYVLGGLAAGWVYRALGGHPQNFTSEESLRAFLGATCGFYVVNTLLVSTAASLELGRRLLPHWIDKFQWTAYSFLAGGSFALLVIVFIQKAGLYSFFLVFPFCALIYHSWRVYAAATGLEGSSGGAAARPSRVEPGARRAGSGAA
jgi:hypothetical protein